MSSHRRRIKHFSRTSGPRKALLRGLVVSLVENERIKTTVDRAKEVRRHIEKAVTIGKKGDLSTRRLLLSRYPHQDVVKKIVDDLSVRFKTRLGGYTRVIKIGRRPGDTAEMAFLEFVDYDFSKKNQIDGLVTESNVDTNKKVSKEALKAKKVVQKAVVAKKKSTKKVQKKSRLSARG
ncbi:MAG: 50S ribosomal protein L17 [Pseudobdellovibrionaceae bacterium]